MKPQAALVDVIYTKIAKNASRENIESVFEYNEQLMLDKGLSPGWVIKLKNMITRMAELPFIFYDEDRTLSFGEFTDLEKQMIDIFTRPYVTMRNSPSCYFFMNHEGKIVNGRGHVCRVYAIRVTFGTMYAPIVVPITEVTKIREHVQTFTRQLEEYNESVYFELDEEFSRKPNEDQTPMLFYYLKGGFEDGGPYQLASYQEVSGLYLPEFISENHSIVDKEKDSSIYVQELGEDEISRDESTSSLA
jgi:hypothetical protein